MKTVYKDADVEVTVKKQKHGVLVDVIVPYRDGTKTSGFYVSFRGDDHV